jgi:hypothetical protein
MCKNRWWELLLLLLRLWLMKLATRCWWSWWTLSELYLMQWLIGLLVVLLDLLILLHLHLSKHEISVWRD